MAGFGKISDACGAGRRELTKGLRSVRAPSVSEGYANPSLTLGARTDQRPAILVWSYEGGRNAPGGAGDERRGGQLRVGRAAEAAGVRRGRSVHAHRRRAPRRPLPRPRG